MKLLLTLLAASMLLAAPARAAKDKGDPAVTIDPTFWDRTITKIGLLDLVYPHMNDDRMYEVEDMIQAMLQDQGDFELFFPGDIKSSGERVNKTAYETLLRTWKSRRELDPPSLDALREALGVDALIGVELTHWEQHQLEFTEEGNSTTTVGLRAWMWDTKDRTLLWESSLIKVSKSPPYNPSGSTVSDAGGGTRQGIKSVPEAPRYEIVSEEVVEKVIGAYPKPEDREKAGKKSRKKKSKGAKDEGDAGR
jgi:hypothetical protein